MQEQNTCECGCGEEVPRVVWSHAAKGLVKDTPRRWVDGHQNRSDPFALYRVDVATGCWDWQGARSNGYGVIVLGGQRWFAHRFFYKHRHGLLPNTLDHLCRNRACVNPDHLEPLSRGENVRRGDVAKLDWDTVAMIRQQAGTFEGRSQREIARILAPIYGMSATGMRGVLRGTRWPESERPAGRRGRKK